MIRPIPCCTIRGKVFGNMITSSFQIEGLVMSPKSFGMDFRRRRDRRLLMLEHLTGRRRKLLVKSFLLGKYPIRGGEC